MASPNKCFISRAKNYGCRSRELHTHYQYPILDATLSIPALVKKTKESGMKQVALTDDGNLFGARKRDPQTPFISHAGYKNLVKLSGCIKSPFAHAITTKNPGLLRFLIEEFKTLFKEDFYFELQRHPSTREDLELDGTFDEFWLFQQYQENLSKQKLIEQEILQASKIYQISYESTQNYHYGEQ
ncbi:hypothetical protein ACTFIR_003913 [Dictyostelium discoideum]